MKNMENHRFTSKFGPAKARSNIKRIRQQKVHLNVQDSVHASVNPTSSHIEDDYNQPKTPSHSVHATADRASHDAEDHFNICNSFENETSGSAEESQTISSVGYPNCESLHHDSSMDTGEAHIVSNLQKMLDENNAHAKSFRMAKDRLTDTQVHNVRLKLIVGQEKDGRTYNVPSVPEVAALIAGDIDANSNRDIIVETQNGQLQRVHELHCSYLALQYPLLFPYGEDGYRPDILHCDTLSGEKRKRNRLTMREWFAYRLQCRPNEGQTLLHSRKVFQQFVAEGYTMIESERLSYVRNNQKKLRSSEAGNTEGLGQDKRIILPSTFVGSPRYMDRLYFDGIAICSHVGFPNLFITFTCNPNWPEIHKLLTPLNLTPIDRPEIISRIFKLKYEQMLSYITKNHLLGKVLLKANQSSLKDYPSMPYPENANLLTHADNDLFLSELNFNNEELRSKFLNLFSQMTGLFIVLTCLPFFPSLCFGLEFQAVIKTRTIFMHTDQQAKIYNQIIQAVNKNEGGMFFLYGYGGTGKTFIWKTLAASLRADNKLVIMVASSGIASLLLPGGKTAHSKLKILVSIFEDSTCNIHQGTQLAELLNEASLEIIESQAETSIALSLCEIMGTTTNDNNNNFNSTSKSDANDNKNNNTRVVLNVYDLTPLNNTFIVHGREYGFGAHDFPTSGVFEVEPRKCPRFVYRCSVTLGHVNMHPSEFRTFIESIANEYHGDTYHLISKNCNHFTNDMSHRLNGKRIPGWVNRLARLAVKLCLGDLLVMGSNPETASLHMQGCLLPECVEVTTVKQLPEYHECSEDEIIESLSTASPCGSQSTSGLDDDQEKRLLSPLANKTDNLSFVKEAPLK
ncbi:DeSI-like protein [Glycine soja]